MDLLDYGRFLAALLFVLGLIALVAWLARRFRLGRALRPGRRGGSRCSRPCRSTPGAGWC